LLAEELQKDGTELARAIKEAALAGDATAMNLWVQRLNPLCEHALPLSSFSLILASPYMSRHSRCSSQYQRGESIQIQER